MLPTYQLTNFVHWLLFCWSKQNLSPRLALGRPWVDPSSFGAYSPVKATNNGPYPTLYAIVVPFQACAAGETDSIPPQISIRDGLLGNYQCMDGVLRHARHSILEPRRLPLVCCGKQLSPDLLIAVRTYPLVESWWSTQSIWSHYICDTDLNVKPSDVVRCVTDAC